MISKFKLYEESVQSPNWQVDYLPQFHKWLTGRVPTSMREDFCGTARISCEWARRSKKNRAVGLDLDDETLKYAETVNKAELTEEQRRRVVLLKQNVLKPTREKFDLIGAYNFSFFIFHERREMLKYARAAYASLKSKGTFFLELAGGDEFLKPLQEPKTVKVRGVGSVKCVWEQHQFDPVTAVNDYSIHFRLPDGSWINDAFTYHWRIWGIRDLREILEEAGFDKTVVLWEKVDRNGDGTGEFIPVENGDHRDSFVAYVVGVKGAKR